jgi:hypothetical protein
VSPLLRARSPTFFYKITRKSKKNRNFLGATKRRLNSNQLAAALQLSRSKTEGRLHVIGKRAESQAASFQQLKGKTGQW